jgi:tricorn protease
MSSGGRVFAGRVRSARTAFPNVAVLYEIPVTGGMEKPLPIDWGFSGSYSPDGKSLAFNRHPAVWSRQHYRGSYAADLWIANLANGTYTKLLGDERYNRYWPMWGADDAIYFVADPVPNDKTVKAGSFEVRKSANNIYKIPRGAAVVRSRNTPTATSSGRRCQ